MERKAVSALVLCQPIFSLDSNLTFCRNCHSTNLEWKHYEAQKPILSHSCLKIILSCLRVAEVIATSVI